nr:hypothetical protein [uncultured Caproiciproducens sp.]
MKNKKVIIIFASIVLLAGVFSIWKYIYNTYYMIDISPFKYVFLSRSIESPDKKHSVGVYIYKTTEDSDIAYIMGTVGMWAKGKGYTEDSKTIFWQKISSNSIKEKPINGITLGNWIDVTWLDEENVNINGISVNINRRYDYRRDWSTSTWSNEATSFGASYEKNKEDYNKDTFVYYWLRCLALDGHDNLQSDHVDKRSQVDKA